LRSWQFIVLWLFVLVPTTRVVADQVPNLDVAKSCLDAENYGVTPDPKATYKNCMLDEQEAKAELQQKWSRFKPDNRRSCVSVSPGPSYVEMLTCLEMNEETLLPYSGGGSGIGPPAYGTTPHDSPSPRPPPSPGPRGMP
jgi:hypothetical protein